MSLKTIKFGAAVKDDGGKNDRELLKEETRKENSDSECECEILSDKNTFNETKVLFVSNIPKDYRSADLRTFFSEFIEKDAFDCFHYRHRPETKKVRQKTPTLSKGNEADLTEKSTCCCIIKVKNKFFKKFKQKYHKRCWYGAEKLYLNKTCCIVVEMNVDSTQSKKYLSKKELLNEKHLDSQDICLEDFGNLIEFDPPTNVMPQGNVGTPSKYFHAMISNCTLPSSVIKSLGLSFKKGPKQYSSVQMDYGNGKGTTKSMFVTEKGREKDDLNEESSSKSENKESDAEDGGDTEEWDRYNALHDDVDNQSRPKERLFEEDLEVKWEKGGSGLVFYTDAYFWNEMKGKDFDEDTVDDWDVDYSVYYEDGAGDKPSRDQLGMRLEKRRRDGRHDGPTKYSEIRHKEKSNRTKMTESFAEFEKHSKSFGSRILKRQGWSQGDGVGSSKQGIKEPLDIQGQKPRNKIGLGFYGEKLDRSVAVKRPKRVAENDVYISTIYDEKDGEHLDAMRFHGKDLLKYRTPGIDFRKASSSSTASSKKPTT